MTLRHEMMVMRGGKKKNVETSSSVFSIDRDNSPTNIFSALFDSQILLHLDSLIKCTLLRTFSWNVR